jgi:anaerobic magnesium-protoporphyrin IX monomethyl ester cyclase
MRFGLIIATKQMDNYDYNSLPVAGIGYLAGMIKKELPHVDLILDQDLDSMIGGKPDIVGISSVTENYHIAIDWATKIKEKLKVPVIIGGIHITLLPLSIKSCFDLAVLGEGEYAIVEILKSFMNSKNTLDYEELAKVKGLFFIKDDKPVMTEARELVADLDSLPTISYDELPFYRKEGGACIIASRGCPFRCSFCASEKMFRKYRSFSVERIMKDVRYFVKLGKKHIIFYDDLLIADKKRLERLVNAIETEKINTKCTFSCQVRADRITPEVCKLLQRMGVTDVGIGTESFSDKLLKFYNKTSVTAEVNQRAIDMLHEHKILVNPSIILGASVETKEDMLITLRKIFENVRDEKVNTPMWSLLRPYPGTMIWDLAEKKGLVGNDMEFSKFSDWSNFELYLCEHVSRDEFTTIMREWSTKIALLYQKKGVFAPESNFALKDRTALLNSISWLSKLIKQPHRQSELGDDLIVEAEREDYVAYLAGWYPPEENYRWMSKESCFKLKN